MSEWVSIEEAAHLAAEGELTSGRRKVIQAIADGFMRARAFRSRERYSVFNKKYDQPIFRQVVSKGLLDTCNFPLTHRRTGDEICDGKILDRTDLLFFPATADDNWGSQTRNDNIVHQYRVDWRRGHFQRRLLTYTDSWIGDDVEAGFRLSEIDIYSVEVEGEAVRRLFPHSPNQNGPTSGRGTMYDWESAFADVAAALYFDLEFQDTHARGVPAELQRALQQSFIARGLRVPEESTLKKKAQVLAGALRGFQARNP